MTKCEQQFIVTVWDFWRASGRHDLPWRKTTSPYRILVSEIMLQQTQVERVIPKYRAFLKQFPTVHVLACAPLGEVLTAWQGLGYNRRAKMLHECAKRVMYDYGGTFPKRYAELKGLPGIGPYTAGAILAFAYNQAVPIIETNIRTVYLHHFFKNKTAVSDQELVRYIARTLDNEKPREWYAALMDYGTRLKKEFGNQNNRSRTYTKQSKFAGSDRQIRGTIIRVLLPGPVSFSKLCASLSSFEKDRVACQLERLRTEGLIKKVGRQYRLPD